MIEDLLIMDSFGVVAVVVVYLAAGLFYDPSYSYYKANKPMSKLVMDAELLDNKEEWVRRQRLKIVFFAAFILIAQVVGLFFAWLVKGSL